MQVNHFFQPRWAPIYWSKSSEFSSKTPTNPMYLVLCLQCPQPLITLCLFDWWSEYIVSTILSKIRRLRRSYAITLVVLNGKFVRGIKYVSTFSNPHPFQMILLLFFFKKIYCQWQDPFDRFHADSLLVHNKLSLVVDGIASFVL